MELYLDSAGPEHYETGQTVSGVLRVNTTDPWTAADVTVALIGAARVEWAPENVYGMYTDVAITLPLTFFERKTCLEMMHKVTEQDIKARDGYSEIPFHFELPHGIPSSFQSDDAEVVYRVVAVIKTTDEKEHKVERKVKILAPVVQKLSLPVTSKVEKHFGLVSFGHGKIILHASLSRKGFYPGETILLHCDIQNESTVECTPRATLYQTRVFMFGERHKSSQLTLGEPVIGKKVDKHSNANEVLAIAVPQESSLTIKSAIITIKYMIHVTLDIPHAFDIHVNLPFVVSTRSALSIHD